MFQASGMRRKLIAIVALFAVALYSRFAYIHFTGHPVDVATFSSWISRVADVPWAAAYPITQSNYPPGGMLIFELIGRAYRIAHGEDNVALNDWITSAEIYADIAVGILTFFIARRFCSFWIALGAMAIWLLNPAAIYASGIWKQMDGFPIALALGAVLCQQNRARWASLPLIAIATLIKPPIVVLAPLFLLDTLLVRKYRDAAIGVTASVLGAYLISLPFFGGSVVNVLRATYAQIATGSSLFPYNSTNAFNWWALWGDFYQPDIWTKPFAMTVFGLIYAGIMVRFWRARSPQMFIEACFLTMLCFFMVLTEMHERYLLYALGFLPVLAVTNARYAIAFAVLSYTQWLNMEYSLVYVWIEGVQPANDLRPHAFMPVLVHSCALANVTVMIERFGGYFFKQRVTT